MTPLIVSYSEVSSWDVCQRQFYYSFGLRLQPTALSEAITTGTKGHKLLQSFYTALQQGETKEHALKLTEQKAKNMMHDKGPIQIDLLKAWTLVSHYIDTNEFTHEVALVENRFLIPVAELCGNQEYIDQHNLWDVQIGFTPDIVFKRPGDNYDVEDSKFVQRAWPKTKINRFQQAKLYQIFLKRMGYNVTRSAVRFFNVTTNTITAQNYVLSKAEEDNIINDFVRGVAVVAQFKRQSIPEQETARRTMNYSACQYCFFEFPCGLEAEGKDASKTLKYQYVKKDYDYSK